MKKFLLLSIAALALFSCSKHDDSEPMPLPDVVEWCGFQLHYFAPTANKNIVVADSILVDDELYAARKWSSQLYSYGGLPTLSLYFAGRPEMKIKLYKENSLIYDQNVKNLQNGGYYHIVIYDLAKEPAIFTRINEEENYNPHIRVKFANFLYQNPTTKFPGTVRLQYAYQDDDNWKTVDKALKFGEATEGVSINIVDQYQSIRLRVVDQNGCVITSGEDGVEVAMEIAPDAGIQYSVFFVGGNIEEGQPAELYQWKSR
ncbi:MAG: hypothetical protein J6X91_07385 [Bacteroidales bacterium]|nr:hypothetical protein [Bacteroidales bacterium]